MRTIESKILAAIDARKPFRVSRNGEIHDRVLLTTTPVGVVYQLCNASIAFIDDDTITLRTRGWHTNTTKSRLNAIARHFNLPTIYQKNFIWYWSDGLRVEGERTFERKPPKSLNESF